MTVEQAPPPPGLVYILGWWREVSTAPLMSAVGLTARPRAQTGVAHIADDAGNVMYGVGVSAATDPEGRALLTLVWVEGAVYDVEFGGVKGTLRCDDWDEGSTVPFTGIRGLPGGDGIADPLTWDTVIAGLNDRIASQVPPVVATAVPAYLSAHPDIIEDAATAAGAAAGAAAALSKVDKNTLARRVADAGSLAAALAAASGAVGGTVLVDPGMAAVPAGTIPTKVRIAASGAGAVLTQAAAAAIFLQTAADATDILIENVTIDTEGLATSYALQVSANTKSFTLRNCRIRDNGGTNTLLELRDGVEDVLIENCRFEGDYVDGIRVNKNAKRVRIRNCTFTGWKGRAVFVLSSASYAPSEILIEGCRISSPGALTTGSSRQPISIQGVDSDPITDVRIIGNTIVGTGTSWTDTASPGVADMISLHRTRRFVVSDNALFDGGDGGINIAMQCDGGTITGNTIVGTDSVGIFVGSDTTTYARNVAITGNMIQNCGQNRKGDRPTWNRGGVRAYNASRLTITGNVFADNQATATMQYGVMLRTGTSGVDLSGNNYVGCAAGKVYRDATVSGVRYGSPEVVVKPSPTVRNNTAVLADDPHLKMAVDPNAAYIVEAMLVYTATAAADVRMQWTGPAGSSYLGSPDAVASADTSGGVAATIDRRGIALGSGTAHGGAGGQSLIARPVGRFATGATGGYLTLQWAQQVAEASDATMLAYSWLKLTRVA